jgi:nitric oxide reductase subunit B
MALFALNMYRKGGRNHPNKVALYWTLGSAIVSFVGAGLLGLAHTLPAVNMYTHGTLVTAMHGHLAFWGAYGMIVFAMIAYALPEMTGRKLYDKAIAMYAFWLSLIGMVGMTTAFAAAGVAQVYLERRVGLDFMVVQQEIQVHFLILILSATIFTTGIIMFIINFIQYGRPNVEVIKQNDEFESIDSTS